MSCKQVFAAILLCMVLLMGPEQVVAASDRSVSWTVDKIGTFNVPQEWQTIELGEVLELVEKDRGIMKAGQAELAIPQGKPDPLAALKAANMSFYHLTMHNNKAYYTSALFLFKDQKPISDAERQFFGAKITAEQREQIETMIKNISDTVAERIGEATQNKTGLTMLEMAPVEYVKIDGKQAYGEGVRIVATVYGLTCPLYAKGYVFDAKGSLAIAVLVTSDAERTFWDPVIRKVVRSYH